MTANQTNYLAAAGNTIGDTTEANRAVPIRVAGTVTNLYANVSVNTNINGFTLTLRKTGADTALTVAFGNVETGIKQDTSNSVSYAATDTLDIKTVAAADGAHSTTLRIVGVVFTPTDSAKTYLPIASSAAGTAIATASTTGYGKLGSILPTFPDTTEANHKLRMQAAATFSNFHAIVSANTRTTNTVFRTRKNGADGTQSVTYGNAETGTKEDTSNTDTVVVPDDFNYSITTDTGVGTLAVRLVSASYSSAARTYPLVANSSAGSTTALNLTVYREIVGNLVSDATESLAQIAARTAATLRMLTVNVSANTLAAGAATVYQMRKNTADGNMTVSYGSGETGVKEDTTNTDAFVSADVLNSRMITPNVASGTIVTQSVTLWAFSPPDVTESLAVQVSEVTNNTTALLFGQESLPVGLSDTAALLVTVATVESVAIALSEQAFPVAMLATADSLAVQLAEAASTLGLVPASDSLRLSLTEAQAALLVIVAAADALGVTLSEAAAILVTLATSDSLAVVLTETGSVTVTTGGSVAIAAADTLVLQLGEAAFISGTLSAIDAIAVQLSESAALAVLVQATDALAAVLSDAGAVAVLLAASDATALQVSERTFVAVSVSPAEALALGMTETAALLASVAPVDSLAVVLVETPLIVGTVFAADTVTVQVGESSVPLVSVSGLAEALRLQVSEVAGIIENHVATESLAVAVSEVAEVTFTDFGASPSGGVGGAGLRQEWIFQPRKIAIRQRWR